MLDGGFSYVCRGITTFTKDGDFDEKAFVPFMERFIEPKIGVYVASSGSGVGQALTNHELSRIYELSMQVCGGKVPVGANIPEQYTSRLSIEHAKLAAQAGVDIINIYGPDGRHKFRATDDEYRTYFDRIFAEVKYPISLCPNPTIGYMPSAATVAAITDAHRQVENIVLTGIKGDDMYFINLMDSLKRDDVEVYVTESGSFNTLLMGAAGLAGNLANFIPKTYRSYLDLVAARKLDEASAIYARIRKLTQYTERWKGSSRWHIMFLKAFKLPGGEGRLPDPYLMYNDAETAKFAKGILQFGIPEIDEMARQAGLSS